MIDESESIVNFELKERFYYLKLLDEADSYCWKDRNENFHLMEEMDIKYLRNCIATVKKDLIALIKARGESDVVKILKPIAEGKLKELEEIYQNKTRF